MIFMAGKLQQEFWKYFLISHFKNHMAKPNFNQLWTVSHIYSDYSP